MMNGYEPPIADPEDYALPKDFRIIDTHVHWWDHAEESVTWGSGSKSWQHPRLMWSWRNDQDRWSAPEYRTDAAGLGVIKTVHLQHAAPVTPAHMETAWLQSVADRYGWPNGIMARGHLADASASKDLELYMPYANFRGIRDVSGMGVVGTP